MASGVAVALMLVGLLVGFLLGTRGRQILAAAKSSLTLVAAFTFKIAPTEADGDDGDDRLDEELPLGGPDIEEFLSTEQVTALEDHPDVEVNPIILYQVKLAKEQARADRVAKHLSELRDKYIAEGLSEDEIVEKLLEGGEATGPSTRQNALQLLISVGASVVPGGRGGNKESVDLQDRRRRLKNVESYLAQTMEVEVKKTKADKKNAAGVKVKDAYDVARETSIVAFDGGRLDRSAAQRSVAKAARNIYRGWMVRNPYATDVVNDDDDEEKNKEIGFGQRRTAADVDKNDLASLQAEFAGIEMGDVAFPEDEEEDQKDEAAED